MKRPTKRPTRPAPLMSARVVELSGNAKMGPVSATYAPIGSRAEGGSCPRSCAFLNRGCYAQGGRVALAERRLARGPSALAIARDEARAIDAAWSGGPVPQGWPIRLHVSGDARTPAAARTLARAIERWRRRGGGIAWSYTHAWRRVRRSDWGSVSVLASIERVDEADEARARGYAPALVVGRFPSRHWREANTLWVACPAQTQGGRTCVSCRLCWDADKLVMRGIGIAFEAHGVRANAARRSLVVIQ